MSNGTVSPIDAMVKRLRIERRYTNHIGRRFAAVVRDDGVRVDVVIRESIHAVECLSSAREIKVAAAVKLLELDAKRARSADDDPFVGL